MLKLTYTEAGLHLEQLTQPLEEWIALRVVLSMRTGQPLMVAHNSASVLFPANLAGLHILELLAQQEESGAIQLAICDADYVEIVLKGAWITSKLDEIEGIFVTTLSHHGEFLLFKVWQDAQRHASSLRR